MLATLLVVGGVVALLLGVAFVFWLRQAGATPEQAERIEASAAAFLAAHHDAIEATRRPVVRIGLLPMDADDPRVSKVGGAPWWPPGEPLPRDANDQPLALLAQVDLGELPGSGLDLPAQGLLQFFIATDTYLGLELDPDPSPAALGGPRGHRVVYWPDASGPTQAVPLATAGELPLDPARPLRMHFHAGTEVLNLHDARFEALFDGGLTAALQRHGEPEGLDADALRDVLWEHDTGPGHKLGGYPNFTQGDPRGRTDLELLFQLDSDDGVMWGDCGVGNFFITDADLARRDFSRVLYRWDCC
jgi:uncharacterized protein YwqG